MLGQVIWCASIALELALLLRGVQNRLVYRLPVFYTYILFVALQEVVRFFAYNTAAYRPLYWSTEFLGLAAGSLVVFEIYKVALGTYPGAARMARNALSLVFLIALIKGVLNSSTAAGWQTTSTAFEIERELRLVQATAILALVALFLLYSIPFGRNLRGILLGYGLFIAGRVISLTFISPQANKAWLYAYSISYVGALSLWLGYLWSYQPSPQPKPPVDLDDEYRKIARATQRRLHDIRGYFRRVVRS